MATPTISIDMDQACSKCGKSGACANGVCLACNAKRIMTKSQLQIPGTEGPSHPKIDEACDNYIRLKVKKKDLGEKLKEAEAELVAAMLAKELHIYRYDNTLIRLEDIAKVKIEDVADADADGD